MGKMLQAALCSKAEASASCECADDKITCSDGEALKCPKSAPMCTGVGPVSKSESEMVLCHEPTCQCVTPLQGTSGKNAIRCNDGTSMHCAASEECFVRGVPLPKSYAKAGGLCRTPLCHCKTPRQGAAGHNKIDCTHGANVWCASHQECYKDSWEEVPFTEVKNPCRPVSKRR